MLTARARLVLALVARAAPQPWLPDVLLPTSDGDLRPVGELLLPGGRLASVVDTDAGFGEPAAGLADDAALVAVGVLDAFAAVTLVDVDLSDPELLDGPLGDVDGVEDWLDDLLDAHPGAVVATRLEVVRDLDLVRPDRWREALALLPLTALADVAVTVNGRPASVTSPTRAWLAGEPCLDGHAPVDTALQVGLLTGLWPAPPAWLDPGLAAGIGVRATLPSGSEVLARLAEPDADPPRAHLAALHALALDDPLAEAPERWRAVLDGEVVLTANPVLVDAPDLLPLLAGRAWLPLPAARAVEASRRWVLPLASRLAPFEVLSTDPLVVADVSGAGVRVPWRVVAGEVHAATPRGRGLGEAWLAGRWAEREALVAAAEGRAEEAAAEADLA